jgi:hypothetical protein
VNLLFLHFILDMFIKCHNQNLFSLLIYIDHFRPLSKVSKELSLVDSHSSYTPLYEIYLASINKIKLVSMMSLGILPPDVDKLSLSH